ncbi:EexN family lipoprotein [Vibrio sp. ArtGut-C1]|uniref:EexN family lipoprotein n=1 Tax=Vibrio sp. ArtGut-C1 TaxID=2259137 RepID=UPI000A18F8FC|nr:EexN family lipoprotein [Vibrio sp. ArtGut-C1]
MKKLSTLCFFSLILLGCSQEKTKTVEYYQKHEQERIEKVEECKNDAAKAKESNCQNAISADAKEDLKNLLRR